MGVATTAAPYGFWATNPTEKLAHWVYLLGQPLSRNRVFQNFSGEPPLKGEAAKGAVRLMGQGDWTLETAPSGEEIIKVHSTSSNNFLHTLNN